ncbi:MAG: DUF308 domain-containing protein [Anaerolineaceae bacterium]|nr:DUF308 domain-containing protein [Anaerolineaceae bacterium]
MSKLFKNLVVDAIGLTILGLVLVIWSKYSLAVIFAIIGIGLIAIGVLKSAVYFFIKTKENRSITDLLIGLLMIAGGIFLTVRAEPLTNFFPAVSAVLLGYGAVRMIIQAVKSRFETLPKFLLPLIFGIVSLVVSAVVFVHPVFLLNIMVQAAGAAMVIEGLFLLILLVI